MYAVKKPNGKWMVQFRLNGKTKAVTAPTRKEAEYKARKMQFEAKQEQKDLTVGKMISKYIDSRDGIEWKIGLAWANTRGSLNSPS